MDKANFDIWEIIEKKLFGYLTEDETLFLSTWLNNSKENRRIFEIIENINYKAPESFHEIKKITFSKIHSTIQAEKANARKLKIRRYGIAASLAILLGFTGIHYFINKDAHIACIETKVPYGQRTKITLSDSTIVYLNSGSSLKYPAQFKNKSRAVTLQGEAYFEVKKSDKHQFIVQTESVNVRVFGTHFNVKSFPNEDLFETILIEGSVGIYAKPTTGNPQIVRLTPNQKATYNVKSGQMNVSNVEAKLMVSWKDGRFYFEKETLASITKSLERHFNVPIFIVSDELSHTEFAGLFDKNKTIYQILDIMKRHNKFNYKTLNDSIIIYAK